METDYLDSYMRAVPIIEARERIRLIQSAMIARAIAHAKSGTPNEGERAIRELYAVAYPEPAEQTNLAKDQWDRILERMQGRDVDVSDIPAQVSEDNEDEVSLALNLIGLPVAVVEKPDDNR